VRHRLADVLAELAAAAKACGSLATKLDPPGREQLQAGLKQHLAAAHEKQDRLSERLDTDPSAKPVGWPLRGELISHLSRFRTELEAGQPDGGARRRRNRLRLPSHVVRRRRLPAWRRLMK
jgi:hypothetical protein